MPLLIDEMRWPISEEGKERIIAMDKAFRDWALEHFNGLAPGKIQTEKEIMVEIIFIIKGRVKLAALERMFENLDLPTCKIYDVLKLGYLETIDKLEMDEIDRGDPWNRRLN